MPKSRHEPLRTCVACRTGGAKATLVRLCRDSGGLIQLDPGGRAPGRGAYLHPASACATLAQRRRALQRALKADLSPETTKWLEQQASEGA